MVGIPRVAGIVGVKRMIGMAGIFGMGKMDIVASIATTLNPNAQLVTHP